MARSNATPGLVRELFVDVAQIVSTATTALDHAGGYERAIDRSAAQQEEFSLPHHGRKQREASAR
jgi:hypothetical protein